MPTTDPSTAIPVANPSPPAVAPPRFQLGFRRNLDGVRGISILLVVLAHLSLVPDNCAAFAVNNFFVLSGFLITCILIAEWNKTGDISFKRFYARRSLRLLPALVVMLAVVLLVDFLIEPRYRAVRDVVDALRALFYHTNWAQIFRFSRNGYFVHTWSLSIEEQFYLLWPLALWFLLRKSSPNSALCWILLAVVLSVLVRTTLVVADHETVSGFRRVYLGLDTRADSLLLGCFAGALLTFNLLPQGRWLKIVLRCGSAISVVGLTYLCARVRISDPLVCCAGLLAASLFSTIIITQLVVDPGAFWQRIVESAPLVYLGKISYGLYLWHSPLLRMLQTLDWPHWKLIYLPLTAAVTLASYYLIELPFLRQKQRFASDAPARRA